MVSGNQAQNYTQYLWDLTVFSSLQPQLPSTYSEQTKVCLLEKLERVCGKNTFTVPGAWQVVTLSSCHYYD